MTPTATYIAEENCLQELPQMKKPIMPIGPVHLSTAYAYERALAEYNAHLATLRKIPCDPSCKGLWADQQKLVVGKDYEVKECRTWTQKGGEWGCAECCNKDRCDEDCDATYYRPNCPFCKGEGWFKEQPLFAFPLVPVSEEELWEEVMRFLKNETGFRQEYVWKMIDKLKSEYSLTKR